MTDKGLIHEAVLTIYEITGDKQAALNLYRTLSNDNIEESKAYIESILFSSDC